MFWDLSMLGYVNYCFFLPGNGYIIVFLLLKTFKIGDSDGSQNNH